MNSNFSYLFCQRRKEFPLLQTTGKVTTASVANRRKIFNKFSTHELYFLLTNEQQKIYFIYYRLKKCHVIRKTALGPALINFRYLMRFIMKYVIENFLRLDKNMKSILVFPECWHDDDDFCIKIVMAYV